MKIQDILKSEYLPVITGLYENPHLVVDVRGNIFFANQAAIELFDLSPSGNNIFDVFSGQTSELFYTILKGLYKEKDKPEIIQISLRNGTLKTVKLRYSFINEGDEKFLSCTFTAEQLNFRLSNDLKISSETEFQNMDLLNLVKNNYPFTMIGKDTIRKRADQLTEYFWIKDLNRKFILINRSLAEYLGMQAEKIEGTNEEMYIPDFLKKVSSSISEYVLNSGKGVTISGILYGTSPYAKERVEIPLLNRENKVFAIAGMTKPLKDLAARENEGYLEHIPKPVAVVNSAGYVLESSEEFRLLFNLEKKSGNINYKKIFPIEVAAFVEDFLSAKLQEDQKDFSGDDLIKRFYVSGYSVKLKRLFRNSEAQILIFIDELKTSGDMQENINQKNRIYDILIQSNPEPVFIYECENLRFIEVNQAALNLYGFSKSEFLQMDLTDLYSPEDIQTLLSALNGNIKEGEFKGPFRQKKKDGNFLFVEISKFNLKYGGKDAHYSIVRDLTRRMESEKETQLFKSAFDNTEQLVFVTDSSGFIRFVNNAVINSLGFTKEELDRTSFAALVKDEERANINNIFKSLKNESKKFTIELKNSKGEFTDFYITASPQLDYKNEVDAFTLLGNIKKKETVKEITKEIVVERIMPAENQMSGENVVLISSIFHEILTPINVILGFVQELTESVDAATPEQKEAAEIINQNRVSLLNTMNSIVEYYNIERKTPDLTLLQMTAKDILDNLQSDFKELSRSRGIDVIPGKVSSSLFFETDKGKFTNLLFLLTKIAGYYSKDKKVFISLYSISPERFAVTFKNKSDGSSPSFVEDLIRIFSPGGMSNTELGIPKLSLRLAARLINIFRGEIFIKEDNSEVGFSFPLVNRIKDSGRMTLTLEDESIKPVVIPKLTAAPAPLRPPVKETFINLSELNCLYIEDQVDSQILFKVQMKDLGDIQFAASFEEALPLLDKKHFDMIVMDINLQGEYNGLDALRIIRKMPEYKDKRVPVIAVTAYLLTDDREKFLKAGFDEFVPKPIFRDRMIEAMEKVFQKR